MGRIQKGYIYEAGGAFFCRYYTTELVDGESKRVQRSHRLCFKDDKFYSIKAKSVKLERDKFMLTVNSQAPGKVNQAKITVADFWEKTYLPFATENLRSSTVSGYKQIWNQFLTSHFGQLTLQEYETHMGSELLTGLAKTYGRNTLKHIRSLGCGIFSHAVNTGKLKTNPWHDVKILGRIKDPEKTPHYTLEEAENIISALVDRVDCQLVIALSCFLGLRPGEIAGLRWEDIDSNGQLAHIRRAVVRGKLGETKTPESVDDLPLIAPVLIPLKLWHEKSGRPSEGWVFPNESREMPVDLRDLVRHTIRPILAKKKKIEWKGLYAGRRGAGTVLVDLTGNLVAAQELLRHKSLTTTAMFYKKKTQNALPNGMKLLEAAAAAAKQNGGH